MTSSRAVSEDAQNLLDFLLDRDMALYVNPMSRDAHVVTWLSPSSDQPFMPAVPDGHVGTYRHWATHGMYSAVLADGSLLQITYWFDRDEVVKHRLAWVPMPVIADDYLLRTEGLVDVLDLTLQHDPESVRLRTAVRLDYDLSAAAETHPASHLTINVADCRIPVNGPVPLRRFTDFVFRHFYPAWWSRHEYLRQSPTSELGVPTITEDQAKGIHLHWRSV